jgi:hypothetical protein
MIKVILGAMKSKTIWLGAAVAALSWLQNFILGVEGLTADQITGLGTFIGSLIIWIRFMTSQSLQEKADK